MSPFYDFIFTTVFLVDACLFWRVIFQCMLMLNVYNSDYLLWHLFKVVVFIRVDRKSVV